jgi:hypothetical protein
MKDVTDKNFGVIIAFWLPGFILLWGLSYSSPVVALWLAKSNTSDAPSIGGFLNATVASLALGMVISAIRWIVVDSILHRTTTLPDINFSSFTNKDTFAVFQGIVENHYRYYQYYSNTLIAFILSFLVYVANGPERPSLVAWLVLLAIIIVLFFASRDSLRKYHIRAAAIANKEAAQ